MISVRADDGKKFTRDAARFKRLISSPTYEPDTTASSPAQLTTTTQPILRKSTRVKKQTVFYKPDDQKK
jgi:hypothetical protein